MLRGGDGLIPCKGVVFGRSAIGSSTFRQVAPMRGIVRNIFAVSKCLRSSVHVTTFYNVTTANFVQICSYVEIAHGVVYLIQL